MYIDICDTFSPVLHLCCCCVVTTPRLSLPVGLSAFTVTPPLPSFVMSVKLVAPPICLSSSALLLTNLSHYSRVCFVMTDGGDKTMAGVHRGRQNLGLWS